MINPFTPKIGDFTAFAAYDGILAALVASTLKWPYFDDLSRYGF
jgi:hypothetical protein